MIVYEKHCRADRHYAGGGIFDTIARVVSRVAGNELVRKAATEAGKKVVESTAKKVGDVAGKKIVSGIDKLVSKGQNTRLNTESLGIINNLTKPNNTNVSISNILEGRGQAIAIEKLAKELNRL